MDKLTEKQRRFIDYYIETANATESARLAGYKGKNLNKIGCENLTKLDIYIKKRLEEKQDDRIATQDEILRYITEVIRDEKINAKTKLKACELMGKRYGIFTEKRNVTITTYEDFIKKLNGENEF